MFYKKLTITLLLLMMIIPSLSYAQNSQKVECKKESIGNMLGSGSFGQLVPVQEKGELLKVEKKILELTDTITDKLCNLDGIVAKASADLIKKLTEEAIEDINTGRNGNPQYIENRAVHYGAVGDVVLENFFEEIESDTIKRLVTENYSRSYSERSNCNGESLDDEGGWEEFRNYMYSDCDEYTKIFNATNEAATRVSWAVQMERENTRNGYFPRCEDEENIYCNKIVTPASTLAWGLESILDANTGLAVGADKVGNDVEEKQVEVTPQVLKEGGLNGLNKSGGGIESFLSQLQNLTNSSNNSTPTGRDNTLVYINGIIATEKAYRNTKIETRTSLEGAESLLVSLIACDPSNATQVASSTTIISSDIAPILNTIKADIIASENIIIILEAIQTRSIESESSTSLQSIISEINALGIHTYSSTVLAESQRDEVVEDMNTINNETNAKLLLCPGT